MAVELVTGPNDGGDSPTFKRHWTRRRVATWAGITSGMYAIAYAFGLESAMFLHWAIADLLVLIVAWHCFQTARRGSSLADRSLRIPFVRAWLLFGLAFLLHAITISYSIYQPFGIDLPLVVYEIAPTCSRVLILIASLVLPAGRATRSWLDGLVGGASLAAILIVIVLTVGYSPDTTLFEPGSRITASYVILLVAACSLLLRAQTPNATSSVLLGLGLLAALGLAEVNDLIIGAGWLLGWLLILFATFRPMKVYANPVPGWWISINRILPSVLFPVAVVALGIAWFLSLRDQSVVVAFGIALLALQIVRQFFAPSGDWMAPNRLGSRLGSPAVILSLLGLLTVWLLYQTLLVSPQPMRNHQGIAFAVRDAYPNPVEGFRTDVVMHVPRGPVGCRNPVSVTAVISGTPALWEQPTYAIDHLAHFAIGIYSEAGRISNLKVGVATDALAPISPEFASPLSSPQDQGILLEFDSPRIQTNSDYAVGTASGSITEWTKSRAPLVVKFDANWVVRRSLGSCYVLLPSLTGKSDLGSDGALRAAVNRIGGYLEGYGNAGPVSLVAGSYGRIKLAVDANVLGDQSSPRSAGFDAGQSEAIWTCAASPLEVNNTIEGMQLGPAHRGTVVPSNQLLPGESSCGGFAVITMPIYEPFNSLALILIGVVVSICVEVVYKESDRRLAAGRQ
jgi:hypothetical protein